VAMTASDPNMRSKAQHQGQVEEKQTAADRGEALKAELDQLLDEIDEVLEKNAMEFERYHVHRGGR
jgi:ubiquitin-like protein Pup